MFMTSLLTITPWPVLSAAILLVLLIAALYLARHTAHQAIHAVTSALARGFRLASHSVAHAEERLAARNREVLLAAGRDAKERMVEREFARIADTTRKDLSNYPDMHRRLSEAIIRIEEDQEKAVEVPPEAPGWAKAVEVIAKLDARNAGAEILADIHKSMVKAHAEAMVDYRKASGERHALLRKMMPDWRLIQETLGRVNKSVASVIERSLVIDRHMQDYEMIGITFAILLLMASIEAGLAYMREVLLQDELATNALLRSDSTGALVNAHLWITTMAQMGMGFILPFALVFAAIPLETFVHSLRTVLGLTGIGVLRALALILRVLGNGLRHLGTLAERIYDLPLFVPLWIEARFAAAHAAPPAIEDESLQEVRP